MRNHSLLFLTILCGPWLLLIGYQHWSVRRTIPDRYLYNLDRALEDYYQEAGGRQRVQLAEQVDVCFKRLSLDAPKKINRAQELNFYVQHRNWMRSQLGGSSPDGTSKEFCKWQFDKFETTVHELIAAHREAEDGALRRLTLQVMGQQILDGFDLSNLQQVTQSLASLLASDESTNDQETIPTQAMLAELLLESVWRTSYQQLHVQLDRQALRDAIAAIDKLPDSSKQRSELLAMVPITTDLPTIDAIKTSQLESPKARILWSCRLGSWSEVSVQLQWIERQQQANLSMQVGRHIARLMHSDLPKLDQQWCTNAPPGLKLAYLLNPGSPELMSFQWLAALQHAGSDKDLVPDLLLESILVGSESDMRHLLLTYSNLISHDVSKAKMHLDLAMTTGEHVGEWVALQFLWYAARQQDLVNLWRPLIEQLCEKLPRSGIGRFALAVAAYHQQDWIAARAAITQARELLGELPALREMTEKLDRETSSVENIP